RGRHGCGCALDRGAPQPRRSPQRRCATGQPGRVQLPHAQPPALYRRRRPRITSVLGDVLTKQVRAAAAQTRQELLTWRNPQGWWTGELSSSALSTATAVTALALVQRNLPGSPSQGISASSCAG